MRKLSGVTGDVLDSFQLDHLDGGHPHPILLSDGTNIWLANSGGTFKRGNWAWLPPSDASRSYIYPFGGDPIWLSGFIGSGLVLDAQKRLVVDELVEWSGTFELGGVTIVNSNHAHQGCARYSNSLLPETGFVGRLGGSLVSGANSVLYSPGQESLFAEYADDGTLIRQGGDHGQPGLRDPQIQGGHLFGHGMSYSSAYAYGGHVLPPNAPLIWSYNPASLQLERFLYFDTVLQNDGNGFAVVDGGKAVVVAVAFRGAFKLPNKTYDFGADTLGVALIKVRLFQ